MSEKRDFVTPTIAVLVLLTMLAFTVRGERADKAWGAMTAWVGGLVGKPPPVTPKK